ncbi:MAG: prepilin peptidase [Opitutales bacterium]|nr:prepilin peptidase [Opitutales bacterium]
MLSLFQEVNTAFPWFFTGAFFVLGSVVGSFLNVCIYRIPNGESVVSPGSHCACGKPIPIWLNVPVLAWLFLRGKAACCGRKISLRYPAVELLTALVFAASWHFLPWDIAVPAMIFSAFAIVLAFIDWDTMFLPDSVNASFVLAGLMCSAAFPSLLGAENAIEGLFSGIVGLGVGSMTAYWFRYFASLVFRREAMGEGDVILLGGIGAFLGWEGALFSFFFSSFIGLFAVLLARIFSPRKTTEPDGEKLSPEEADADGNESSPFPLGPWLILAAVVYFVVGAKLIALYFAALGA